MRLRHFLAATVASGLIVGGVALPAHATTAPPVADAGTINTWGNTEHFWAGSAIPIPGDLAGPVRAIAASPRATGVVTLDGHVRVWGWGFAGEVTEVPAGITEASALSLSIGGTGAVLHEDGHITAWGGSIEEYNVPPIDLRAKAISVMGDSGYAVRTDGTVTTWGQATPNFPLPSGLTGVTDIAVSTSSALALRSDGTVVQWDSEDTLEIPDFGGKKATQIALGTNGTAVAGVIFEDGTIKIWGAAPEGAPTFDGLTSAGKVVSLAVDGGNALAVTADGVVHAWGPDTTITTVPPALTDKPVNTVELGMAHAVALTTIFRELTKPTIAGTPTVGQTLTATPATFSLAPDAAATGQWYAGDEMIAGQTATTLLLTSAHLGKAISYRTSASRGDDDLESASAPTAAVAKIASTTGVSVDPGTSPVGTVRTLTATVTSTGSATGTVTFTVDGTAGEALPLTAGTATLALPADLAAGDHTVSAAYSGDASVAGSSSTNLTVSVTKIASTTALSVSPGTAQVRTSRTITATVAAPGGTSTGTVTFKVGATSSPARPVSGGKATWVLPVGLAAGTHSVTATYSGDATTAGSTSAVLKVGITKAAAKAAVKAKASGKTKKLAKKVTLTVQVKTIAGVSPGGKVVITLNGKTKKKVVATVNSKGVATVVVKNVKRGTYTATVQYAGNVNVKAVTFKKKFKF